MTIYYPTFASKNFLKKPNATLTVSSGNTTANLLKLSDGNPDYRFSTSGQTSGTRWINFFGDLTTATSINTIYIQNTNAVAFTVYWVFNDGVTEYPNIIYTNSTYQPNIYINLADQFYAIGDLGSGYTGYILIEVTSVVGEPAELLVGQLYYGCILIELTNDGMTGGIIKVEPDYDNNILRMSDNTSSKVYVREVNKYTLDLKNIPALRKLQLKNIYDYNKSEDIYFIPKPQSSDWDGEAQCCLWKNGFEFSNYNNNVELNGYDGVIELLPSNGKMS